MYGVSANRAVTASAHVDRATPYESMAERPECGKLNFIHCPPGLDLAAIADCRAHPSRQNCVAALGIPASEIPVGQTWFASMPIRNRRRIASRVYGAAGKPTHEVIAARERLYFVL